MTQLASEQHPPLGTMCTDLKAFANRLAARLPEKQHKAGQIQPLNNDGGRYRTYDSRLETVQRWTEDLQGIIRAKCDQPPKIDVLCAFGSVLDRTCNLDSTDPTELNSLVAWINRESADFPPDKRSQSPTASIEHPQDILAALCAVLPTEGGKTPVENQRLRHKMLQNGFPAKQQALGGAAAIISGVLNRMGVPSCFYAPYHSDAIAAECCDEARWLDLNHTDPLTPQPARVSGCASHPTRYGFVLAYQKGNYSNLLSCTSSSLHAKEANRHILMLKQPVGRREWNAWLMEGIQDVSPLAENEWPILTGFVQWKIDAHTLSVRQVPEEWLRQLGNRHAYVVVTMPQPKEIKNEEITAVLRKQLRLLRDAGAILHLEFSSAAGRKDDLAAFAEFGRACLDSIGVNAEELPTYASLVDLPKWPHPPAQEKHPTPPPPERFEQAMALASKLGIERLYVHGTDIDIILRRGANLDTLEKEREGALFAKGAVFVATTLRNNYTLEQVKPPTEFPEDALKALMQLRDHIDSRRSDRRNPNGEEVMIPALNPEDYGIVAVPCIWFTKETTPSPFNPTGAGDITSGVSVVYSGFRETRQGQPRAQREV